MMVALLLHGHAFAFINRSRATGEIVELVQIPSHAVSVETDDVTRSPATGSRTRSGARSTGRRSFICRHERRSAAHAGQGGDRASLIMEQHQSRLFANGAKPAGMLRLKGRLNPATLERLQADFSCQVERPVRSRENPDPGG